MKLIDKAALIAEIERLYKKHSGKYGCDEAGLCLNALNAFIDTLEVKEANTWHSQEKEDIYNAVKDWGHYTFACIMKDGTIQKFTGNLDEDCEGHINVHIDGVNDDYDNIDDIVKWIEIT